MTKNSLFFICLLVILAVVLGYARFVFIPSYNASQLAQFTPAPSPVPTSITQQAPEETPQLMISDLTDQQKMAQLLAFSLNAPISTTSAVLPELLANEPGFVSVITGNISTASAQRSIENAVSTNTPDKKLPTLFAASKDGLKPKLCQYDEKCLTAVNNKTDMVIFSEPIEIASDSAASAITGLGDLAVRKYKTGANVVVLAPKTSQAQVVSLLEQLIQSYSSDPEFKFIADKNLQLILNIKARYN